MLSFLSNKRIYGISHPVRGGNKMFFQDNNTLIYFLLFSFVLIFHELSKQRNRIIGFIIVTHRQGPLEIVVGKGHDLRPKSPRSAAPYR